MNQSMKRMYLLALAGGVAVGFGLVSLSSAAPEGRRGPPREAIDACKDQTEGSECSVEFRGRTVEGTCVAGPEADDPLACMPAGGRAPGPPPEAYEACEDADEGDECSVEVNDHTMTGTCQKDRRDDSLLVCVPERPKRG